MLAGRTIVITGAARAGDRGAPSAMALVRAMARRLILGDILEEQGRQTAAEIAASGAQVRFGPLDLEDPASIERFGREIARRRVPSTAWSTTRRSRPMWAGAPFESIDMDLWIASCESISGAPGW